MAIYKPSLLDKFKDFVNGLKSNWDQYEDHVADFEAHLADFEAHLADFEAHLADFEAHQADYAKGTMTRIILSVSANSGDGVVNYHLGEEYVQSVVSSVYGIDINLKNIPTGAKLSSNFVITSSSGMNIGGNSVEPFIYQRSLSNTVLQLGIKSSPTSTHRPWNTIAEGSIQVTIAW